MKIKQFDNFLGVGPRADLSKMGIDTISDLAVGCNLKDQVSFMGLNFVYDTHDSEHSHRPGHSPLSELDAHPISQDSHQHPHRTSFDVRFDGPTFVPKLGLEDDDAIAHNYYEHEKDEPRQEERKYAGKKYKYIEGNKGDKV